MEEEDGGWRREEEEAAEAVMSDQDDFDTHVLQDENVAVKEDDLVELLSMTNFLLSSLPSSSSLSCSRPSPQARRRAA
eukprot:762102-Hanusia_phi.AAC.2